MATELRNWLTRQPQPVMLHCYDDEDELRKVKVGLGRAKWRDAEAAISNAARVEALDADGNVMRVCELDSGEVTATGKGPSKGDKSPDIVQLARLLHEAHDAGAARHEAAYRMGFDSLAALVNTLAERLAVMEMAWHKLLLAQQEAAGFDPNAPLVQQVVAMALGGQPPKVEPPKPNGKEKKA